MMFQLKKYLTDWKEAGLLSEEQVVSIQSYEDNRKKKPIAVYTIMALGGVTLSIGIISLIAVNWDDIPDALKLVTDFALLSVLGFLLHIYHSRNALLFEVILSIFILLVMASIGLISQIFHTGGELYQAVLFWSFITLPVVLFSTSKINIHIWIYATLFSGMSFIIETLKLNDNDLLLLFTSFLPAFLLVSGLLLKSNTVRSLREMGVGLLFWSVVTFMGMTVVLSFLFGKSAIAINQTNLVVLLAMSIPLYFLSTGLTFKINPKLSMGVLVGVFIYHIFIFSHIYSFHSEFLDAVLFIFSWFAISFVFHVTDSVRLFNFAILVIGLRFLVVYFQVLGDLALTGFGLIISGLFIMVSCILYIKKREAISESLRKLYETK
jgi:uncharacterized membrane protein